MRKILLSLIFFTLLTAGCINNGYISNEKKDYKLTVGFRNFSESDEIIILEILDDGSKVILDINVSIKKDRFNSTYIICKEGLYHIFVEVSQNRSISRYLDVKKFDTSIFFDIFNL